MLSDRKKKILKAVVDEYILTAQPISSQWVQKEHFEDLSSATIRNELKTLEDMGFLLQPHTSAGRVPSSLAYEHYVSTCLSGQTKSEKELTAIKEFLKEDVASLEDVLESCLKAISSLTSYTTIGKPLKNKERFKAVKLVPLSHSTAILVLVTELGRVDNETIRDCCFQNEKMLKKAEELLSTVIVGKSYDELDKIKDDLKDEFENFKEFLDKVFEALAKRQKEEGLFLLGEQNIFKHKEFDDIDKVKDFMDMISEKDKLTKILDEDNQLHFQVTIGTEENGLNDCSMVSAKFFLGGREMGRLGVIGPQRMDYGKVISVLESLEDLMQNFDKDKTIEEKKGDLNDQEE